MRRLSLLALALLALALLAPALDAHVTLTGRLNHPRAPGDKDAVPLTAVHAFASRDGADNEARTFRTWETHPAGWYRLTGNPGRYSLLLSTPAHHARPLVRTNLFLADGDRVTPDLAPRFDAAMMDDRAFDDKPATCYLQPFTATSTSLTHVGLRLAHDGIDGAGPRGQDLLLSVHKAGPGAPDTWKQVGPDARIIAADVGGPKNPTLSAGWNSGEVPLTPGGRYAVRVRAADGKGAFQARWRAAADRQSECHRTGTKGPTGWTGKQLWLTAAGDGDGLVLPYHKRVHREFADLTKFGPAWSQTYVARGRSLAGVILYAAVAGSQPPISRQRVRVTLRQGGPDGPPVGVAKIATGSGDYTGDASWGVFGVAFAPGEAPVVPGKTYAIEWHTLETAETIADFVNIKGHVSSGKPGFNPYRKHPRDAYPHGSAFFEGKDVGYDLDAQIVEYEHAANNWPRALAGPELLKNGSFARSTRGHPDGWTSFTAQPGLTLSLATDANDKSVTLARLTAAPAAKKVTADAGLVQRVAGLSPAHAYRLAARVRCTFPADDTRRLFVGLDPTGQTDDPKAATIRWAPGPDRQGLWQPFLSDPLRPRQGAISVWLRAQSPTATPLPPKSDARQKVDSRLADFRADFTSFSLRQVDTAPPTRP